MDHTMPGPKEILHTATHRADTDRRRNQATVNHLLLSRRPNQTGMETQALETEAPDTDSSIRSPERIIRMPEVPLALYEVSRL